MIDGTIDRLPAHRRIHPLLLRYEHMTHCATFRAYFFECLPSLFTEAGDRTQRSYVFTQRIIGHLNTQQANIAVEISFFSGPITLFS